jgi:hypothetical protein
MCQFGNQTSYSKSLKKTVKLGYRTDTVDETQNGTSGSFIDYQYST